MGVCVERGCPRPNSHIPQIHPQEKSYYKKQKYLTLWKYNSYLSTSRLPSFWKPKPNNEALSSWHPMVVIWTCSYNESSIHRSIRSTKLPNTPDAKIFNRFAASKKSYDKNGLSQPILALILTLSFWVWINLQIPIFKNIYISPHTTHNCRLSEIFYDKYWEFFVNLTSLTSQE
jgi:hypothetical protein